jgi:plasmid stability protein
MPTLYVENVPEDLYEALKRQAKSHRKSIAAEVIALLEEHVVTEAELAARRALLDRARRIRARRPTPSRPSPSAVEMLREDRNR